jgi:hypothetical protein
VVLLPFHPRALSELLRVLEDFGPYGGGRPRRFGFPPFGGRAVREVVVARSAPWTGTRVPLPRCAVRHDPRGHFPPGTPRSTRSVPRGDARYGRSRKPASLLRSRTNDGRPGPPRVRADRPVGLTVPRPGPGFSSDSEFRGER